MKPTATYTGPDSYPIDALRFSSSGFSDPKTSETFGAMKWRIAEVTKIANAGKIPLTDPSWKVGPVRPGRTYRVRVRMKDSVNVWSHWSNPVEFVAGQPAGTIPQIDGLRVTEIMYDPIEGPDLEFLEIQNRGSSMVDLTGVEIDGGIRFSFDDGSIGSLAPGAYVVVVANPDAFAHHHDTRGIQITGQFKGSLGNKTERIILTFGAGLVIQDFTYDGA